MLPTRTDTTVLVKLFLLVVAVLALAGCDQSGSNPPPPEEPPTNALRIVSLAPALTQMVVDLGLGANIVGVAQNDAAAPAKNLPIVGNYQDLDTEALLKLQPTHVLVMTGAEGVPERLQHLATASHFAVAAYKSPLSITEVGQIIFDEREIGVVGDPKDKPHVPSLSAVLGIPQRASIKVKLDMLRRLADIEHAIAGEAKPNVLIAIGVKPVMASGPGTVHDEVLTSFAGGTNAAGEAKVGAPTYDRESLIALAPDVVLLVMPGAPALKPIAEDERLVDFRGLKIPAVTNNRIVLINDPLALLPSTSLPRVTAAMAKAAHPDRAKAIDKALNSPLEESPTTRPATQPTTQPTTLPGTAPDVAPTTATAPAR
ncbi:MAG: ABC transporter substrate-binding protein [Planctomycetes bacterium]|nr:ABC transporter substrate-binding protein [Planctomycetota bacterium]